MNAYGINGKLLQKFQGTGGTDIHALVAVCTACDPGGILEFGLDDGGEATAHQTQQTLAGIFPAGADTLVAQDALTLVTLNDTQLLLSEALVLGTFKTLRLNLLLVCVVDQTAVAVIVAAAFQAALGFVSCLLLGETVDDGIKVAAADLGSLQDISALAFFS